MLSHLDEYPAVILGSRIEELAAVLGPDQEGGGVPRGQAAQDGHLRLLGDPHRRLRPHGDHRRLRDRDLGGGLRAASLVLRGAEVEAGVGRVDVGQPEAIINYLLFVNSLIINIKVPCLRPFPATTLTRLPLSSASPSFDQWTLGWGSPST